MPGDAQIERFAAMGTRVELHLFGPTRPGTLAAARRAVDAVDDALTIHRPSPATALNDALLAGRVAEVTDDLLLDALIAADAAHAATLGLFDIATDLASGATWDMVAFDRNARTIAADRPLALDFGGLGKGLALDHAGAVLRAGGATSALLSAGESSISVVGDHPLGGAWPFSIPHPLAPGEDLAVVELCDAALSISANVGAGACAPERAALIHPGERTAIAAPRCAVAIAATGAEAEAMSTALMVADARRAALLLQNQAEWRFRFDLDAIETEQAIRMYG